MMVPVKRQLVMAVLEYLGTRPCKEVMPVVLELGAAVRNADQAAAEQAKSKLENEVAALRAEVSTYRTVAREQLPAEAMEPLERMRSYASHPKRRAALIETLGACRDIPWLRDLVEALTPEPETVPAENGKSEIPQRQTFFSSGKPAAESP